MDTLRSNVREFNPVSLPSLPADGYHADLVAMEIEMADVDARDAQFAEINADDATHCRHCGHVTAGMDMAGAHVQLCDSCIIQLVRDQIGVQAI